jgi:hypothetical protein
MFFLTDISKASLIAHTDKMRERVIGRVTASAAPVNAVNEKVLRR